MTEWTPDARSDRDRFLSRQRERLGESDINVDEVIDDLTRHIDEELKGHRLVTRDDVQRIIQSLEPKPEESPVPPPSQQLPQRSRIAHAGLLIFGVALPLIALIIELTTHGCARAFFDPIPTWWHVLIVASVPLINGLIIAHAPDRRFITPRGLLLANTISIVFSSLYTLLFLALLIPGLIGVLYFGIGLIPLAPLLSLIAGYSARRGLLRSLNLTKRQIRVTTLQATCGALLVIAALTLPSALTRIGLEWADDVTPSVQQRGIRFLRYFGQEETMIRACYERPRQFVNLAALLISRTNPLSQEEARTIFFRVTGRPFNAQKPPTLYSSVGRWNLPEDLTWEFDEERGGGAVAGRVRGLHLTGSRLDGHIHQQAALGYFEWTLEFQNDSSRQREARTQILLPPDAVVSRLTLWIDGEEREAAFAGRNHVREAYEKIVRQRRDPVLVTTSGPDRILVQCFPVPPEGGTMKARIGFTAPCQMSDPDQGHLPLPKMIERNFNLHPTLEHTLWFESRAQLNSPLVGLHSLTTETNDQVLRGQISPSLLMAPEAAIHVTRTKAPLKVQSPGLSGDAVITQQLEQIPADRTEHVVLVVDGSHGMADFHADVAQALDAFPEGTELSLLHATDQLPHSESPPNPIPVASITVSEAQSLIRSYEAEGGQDNLRTLVEAWDLAAASPNGVVLWIHGQQPIALGSYLPLQQRVERSYGRLNIHSLQTVPGPNRILEIIPPGTIKRLPRRASLEQDLRRWFERLGTNEDSWQFKRERHSSLPVAERDSLPQVTDHVRRLWAAEHIETLSKQSKKSAAIKLAAQHQLVTSVSGAVVLENKQQFDEAGLAPVPADSVPVIPEPSSWILLTIGLCFLHFTRPRRKP